MRVDVSIEVEEVLALMAQGRDEVDEKKAVRREKTAKTRQVGSKKIMTDYVVERVGFCDGVPKFHVTSPKGERYEVVPDRGLCGCKAREFAATCKHIDGLSEALKAARKLLG